MDGVSMPMNTANGLASLLAANSFGSGLLGQQDHLNKVSGVEGMSMFQTKPSSEYVLFEENSDIFCCKTTDSANNPTYRYFAFHEITKEEAMREVSPYLMKGELEAFKDNILSAMKEELTSFKEEIINAKQSVRNNEYKSNQQRNNSTDSNKQ